MAISLVTHEQLVTLKALADRLDAKGIAYESRVLREVLAQLQAGQREVSASVAAEILEVTPQTIRNWVRGGILPGRRDRTGRFSVSLDALEPAIRMRQAWPDPPARQFTDEEIDAEIEAVRAERRARAALAR